MQGILILLSGPSGSGKGSLVAHVRDTYPEFFQPLSWTTRAARSGEKDGTSTSGKRYRFVSKEQFEKAIEQNAFLEWAQFSNNYYGTPAQEVQDALAEGRVVFQELEIQGVEQLLTRISRQQIKMIFVNVQSWEDLQKRILGRQTISDTELQLRHERYEQELLFKEKADFVLENVYGKFEQTKNNLDSIIQRILQK